MFSCLCMWSILESSVWFLMLALFLTTHLMCFSTEFDVASSMETIWTVPWITPLPSSSPGVTTGFSRGGLRSGGWELLELSAQGSTISAQQWVSFCTCVVDMTNLYPVIEMLLCNVYFKKTICMTCSIYCRWRESSKVVVGVVRKTSTSQLHSPQLPLSLPHMLKKIYFFNSILITLFEPNNIY